MQAKVVVKFECKLTKVIYRPGDTYASEDPERISFLQGEGYLDDTPPVFADTPEVDAPDEADVPDETDAPDEAEHPRQRKKKSGDG